MFRIPISRLIGLLLLIASLYAGFQYLQVYFYASAFDDYVHNAVRFAPARDRTNEDYLKTHILEVSRDFGVNVDEKDVRVKKTRNDEQQFETLEVNVSSTAPLDLNNFKKELLFKTNAYISY